jgi:FlaA1/EpsC-like NDP-sugar epimerase
MKRTELFFSFLLVPLDFLMVVLAGISAYHIRFTSFVNDIRPAIFAENLPFGQYLDIVFLIAFLWLFIFVFSGLYNIGNERKLIKEIYKIILACSTGLMLIVILIFIRRELFDSRFIVLAAWILSILYISLERLIVRLLQRVLFKYGIGIKRVILVGNSKTTDILINYYSSHKKAGVEVVKRVKDFNLEILEYLEKNLDLKKIDEIIQSDPNLTKVEILRLYDFADEHHLTFKYAADLLGTKVLKTEVTEISGIPIVEVWKNGNWTIMYDASEEEILEKSKKLAQ